MVAHGLFIEAAAGTEKNNVKCCNYFVLSLPTYLDWGGGGGGGAGGLLTCEKKGWVLLSSVLSSYPVKNYIAYKAALKPVHYVSACASGYRERVISINYVMNYGQLPLLLCIIAYSTAVIGKSILHLQLMQRTLVTNLKHTHRHRSIAAY